MRYQPPIAVPNEFALAVAGCRHVYSGEDEGALRRLSEGVDWARFLATCRRHRVQGLAWRALGELKSHMSPPVRLALEIDAQEIAAQGLKAAAESQRILKAFSEAGIPVLFLKGLTLGRLAYGDPFVKMGWDIDILVSPDRIAEAAAALSELGYSAILPALAEHVGRWHRSRKESVWRNRAGTVVELHSRLADQPQLLASLSPGSPSQTVNVALGIDLPTLAAAELFAYLCVHGASSAWFRLKWLADLAGLLHGRSAAAIEALYDRATELGAGRTPGQALSLAHWLFEIPLSEGLERQLSVAMHQRLARACLSEMLKGEPTERLFGTSTIHWIQFFALPGWRHKLSELKRQAEVAAGIY